jgi:hypothetical protein
MYKADATALRLKIKLVSVPRVAEAATLGWRTIAPLGHKQEAIVVTREDSDLKGEATKRRTRDFK